VSLSILIDFGSTFTKVVAVDLERAEVLGRSQSPSTVLTDVREGLLLALQSLHQKHAVFERAPMDLSILNHAHVLASSSAAGGLKIVVVGNVPGLTVEAANQAALGAGAKVVGSTAFKLSEETLKKVEALGPDMILLTGGTDGGDSATILHNATMLARSPLAVPYVVAGNRNAQEDVCRILNEHDKETRRAENVMPKTGKLAVEAAREEIRKLFMERITQAKGLDALSGIVPVVLPTPMAVLEGVRLGADGTEREKGWGDMLVVDVGGATTDVHSIGWGYPGGESTIAQGLAEAYAKRTVEGDLGIRFNAATIVERVGLESLAGELRENFSEPKVRNEDFQTYIDQISRETGTVPQQPWHSAADAVLARNAVDIAIARHVGRRERIVAREGEAWLHYGKDLRETRALIGIGGVFVHNPHGPYILRHRPRDDEGIQALRPKNPQLYMDKSYLLYAVGLLSETRPGTALCLFNRYINKVS